MHRKWQKPCRHGPIDWIKTAVELGAGEILLCNVINDGTNRGLDTALIQRACDIVNAPVIFSGGFGVKSTLEFVENTQATGLIIAIFLQQLHFNETKKQIETKHICQIKNSKMACKYIVCRLQMKQHSSIMKSVPRSILSKLNRIPL